MDVFGRMSLWWFRIDQLGHGVVAFWRSVAIGSMDRWTMIIVEGGYNLKEKDHNRYSVHVSLVGVHVVHLQSPVSKLIIASCVIVNLHRYLPYADGLYDADGGGS